jgi:hypothetical protein
VGALLDDATRAPEHRLVACAALQYAFTLDLDGASDVAAAAKAWGFVDAAAGRSIADFASDVPLLVVRAGADAFAGINVALDRLVAAGLRANLPLTCVNLPTAPHAYELERDDAQTRAALGAVAAFFRAALGLAAAAG